MSIMYKVLFAMSIIMHFTVQRKTVSVYFFLVVVFPKPKASNANLADSANYVYVNYRGIALSSMFGKIFDLIVLQQYMIV